MRPGERNLITDVAGLQVGNATDHVLRSGVTVVFCEEPATAAVQVLGGAPGTRETDLLEPHNTVQTVDAVVLSGGSAFGLDAATGVQAGLRERERGFAVGPHRVPIVPAAILFDLMNAGNKDWGRYSPYRDLGYAALENAGVDFDTGSAGAGTGALTASFKGGLGSASSMLAEGFTVGALVAVNALGSATIGATRHFWAAPFEENGEFGGLGLPVPFPQDARIPRTKLSARPTGTENTTIAVIATDAQLTKAEAKRLAIAAHDGFSRAIWPSHTPLDGDLVFALATGKSGRAPAPEDFIALCAAAAATMARAIARGVHDATPMDGDVQPSWAER
ncbi:P1 family peptidase [Shinella curvata]|uniref:P1 family peptidase n=1 Tax=Shinella curvata TaxID=1817964 RepID=A0ABT8X9W4_9HYPH|nr:P1 family peptidase [Shinella curvata]MCJ8052017.1 P1 family peptidase [Shinella curvata]MDO6120035.1 P1 family peptidase [Shinella curvata]